MQIKAILECGGYTLDLISPPERPHRWELALSGIKLGLANGFYRPAGLASLRAGGSQRSLLKALYHRFPDIKGFIFEGTGFGALAGLGWCKRHGLKTVLIPANIESLANYPGAWTHKNLSVSERFRNEEPWLRLADAIFAISIEEAWWLELHGIKAQHLPYHPCEQHLESLVRLRQAREPDHNFGYLLLADFGNAANLRGARVFAELLAKGLTVNHPIHVVGRGMEQAEHIFESHSSHPFIFEGECTELALAEFQRRCLALVLFHPPTSGMLTRVVDAAIANIPIVGNLMGLKSYYHFFSEALIEAEHFPLQPSVRLSPEPSRQAEASLLRTLEA
ncbi:hypothetical protein KBY97_03355 [Synechococcus sp. ATX 2A4]|uniref:hypothetical protein n=1 Tax=Synechococcus sp. ATX 2A4 TaxID=2823727 RepID=UPI0020CD7656|nr:hypothetical protein [Synechococcus sp. ATX 2A4]MCP9884166.1 hypothetical protein [Synechococcus sp. ATX 2A4]